MEKWAFVSDFDGTISKKDFYWQVIDNYFPEGRELYTKWKNGEWNDIDFLAKVFASINRKEEQITEDILSIPVDEDVPDFVRRVQQAGGDFYILSAGTDYYIRPIVNYLGLEQVTVFSNKGVFRDQNIQLEIDPNHWSYSERYGIDKAAVIRRLKEEYDIVYFAGDSEPDSHPAELADRTYATGALPDILDEKSVSYVRFRRFNDIAADLAAEGRLPK
ncbi:2,3-diketo-5-methylthio-1-phosphopentane phosphatase [Domibacillus antri]|uniref:phosphoserine phosphatase n=1 Tax=Domibacillus antri TaxID=1714264 RepID=A0A1Q8Q4I6_9BACI|nr:MtnX-like HAD-IB family phosphatase [Domibacillus antri]OLN22195.1 2,3-diketo-5-methylthio-1-phosphopentane phosphatase [Domibacillus antri]